MLSDTLRDYQPRQFLKGNEAPSSYSYGRYLPSNDLFSDIKLIVSKAMNAGISEVEYVPSAQGIALFVVSSSIAITIDTSVAKAPLVQCLIAKLSIAGFSSDCLTAEIFPTMVDSACGLILWSRLPTQATVDIHDFWFEIVGAGRVEPIESITTPRLYGNKLRLTNFVSAAVATFIPEGTPVLDLMSGTGILSRKFSNRHPVWSNDANPYAALMSRCQIQAQSGLNIQETVMAMRAPFLDNMEKLSKVAGPALFREATFLHGGISQETLELYASFVQEPVVALKDWVKSRQGYSLITERYANFYFGVNQAMELDSLRCAIDIVHPINGTERDTCLSALLLSATTCATGPHFAQPYQVGSAKLMRTIVERRARSVSWEFDLALERIAGRPAPKYPAIGFSQGDWREAISNFRDATSGRSAAVYVDPPYSKLQYSRYYHVLNTLLSYDYPEVIGIGRYPEKTQRFSSRFEYRPESARKEFDALIAAVSESGMHLILSYGSEGFVPIESLASAMSKRFDHVHMFFEQIRHHSQGKVLANSKKRVLEHVLIGIS